MSDSEEKVKIDLGTDENQFEKTENNNDGNDLRDEDIVVIDDGEENVIDGGEDVQEAIRKLNKKLKKEKQARKEAERLAQEAQHKIQKAYGEVEDTNLHLVSSAIDNLRRENESLTSSYAEAMASGEYERAASIQLAMSTNANKLSQLETGFAEMQRQPRQQIPDAPRSGNAMLDQIINSVTPKSARWLKDNREHLSDERMIKRMFRAHEDAVDDGITPDTEEYFGYIENRLGFDREEEQGSPMSAASKPMSRKPAPPAAPVNRSGGRSNEATLTRAEADMAASLGMTEKQYWENKMALKKAGRL